MTVHAADVRVLVVDADPVARGITANVLEAAGFPVVGQAADDTQALEMAAATNPNVAIVDAELGGMGPATLARRLREVGAHRMEIIAQAGFTQAAALGEMVAGGTSAYVIKGKPAELIAATRAVTSGSGLMSAEASRPVLEEIQKLYDRERARNGELEQMVTQLQALSVTDWLTGLKNHGYFFDRLSEELERSRRYDRPLAVIVADLDDFKSINDAYGHSSGDAVLRTIGEIFRTQLREVDVACRIGGEEFGVIMPETGSDGVIRVSERLRHAAMTASVPGVGSVTISLGAAVFPDHAEVRDELVDAADQALYVAKAQGKNQTVLAGQGTGAESRRSRSRAEPLTTTLLRALRFRNEPTAAHSERVAELATGLATHMGLPSHEVRTIRTAALLHDIGRLTLPDSLLSNTGALSEEEWSLMRRHPQAAFELLTGSFDTDVCRIVLTHHEHLDGSGYPTGLRGDEIPLASRMLLVADAYDAMTSHRHYRGAMSVEAALQELRAVAGAQLDPDVVAAFEAMIMRPPNVVPFPARQVG